MVFEEILANPIGLALLMAFIPLIAVYMVRPKPKTTVIPALMFLSKSAGKSFKKSFLQKFINNLLLYLQFFIILLLGIGAASPFLNMPEAMVTGHTIAVLDVSASMQAGRLGQAKDFLISKLSESNTVVLAGNMPEVALEKGDKGQAEAVIRTAEPKDTPTNLYDAIVTAGNFLEEDSKIVIASDFIDTASPSSFETALRAMRSEGIPIEIKQTINDVENVGITGLEFDADYARVVVKNYANERKSVTLKVGGFSKTIELAKRDLDAVTFAIPEDATTVSIETNDGFPEDNIIYLSVPENKIIKVLLITNDETKDRFIKTALESNTEIKLDITNPPSVSNFEYDVIIIGNVDPAKILPGTLRSTYDRARKGYGAIILAHEGMPLIDYEGLLYGSGRYKDVLEGNYDFTDDIKFAENIFFAATDAIALAKSKQNVTAIAYNEVGAGRMMFYGIIDQGSDFAYQLMYPVFWKKAINFLIDRKNVKELNKKAGDVVFFPETVTVKSPTRTFETNQLILDKAGYYEIGNQRYSANLLDIQESDISKKIDIEASIGSITGSKRNVAVIISSYLLGLAILLALFEVFYVKYRGNL